MVYQIALNEAATQYVVGLLATRPINEAGDLYADVRAQITAQEAAAASDARAAIIAEHERAKQITPATAAEA